MPRPAGSLYKPRTIYVAGSHTSLRMEPVFWDALHEIATHEGLSISTLASRINQDRQPEQTLVSAIRVFVVNFYRSSKSLA